jgi:hypothetical protein
MISQFHSDVNVRQRFSNCGARSPGGAVGPLGGGELIV